MQQIEQSPTVAELTPLTMAILPKLLENGQPGCEVLETENSSTFRTSPSKFIDLACKFYGSSLKGRQAGVKEICGITHKAPISIDPVSGMYFFPTSSPLAHTCSWISHSHIKRIEAAAHQCTNLTFKNGDTLTLDVSYGSMMNQVQRTAQYRFLLDKRIRHLWKYGGDQIAEPFV
ncbi:competence protein ComK [Terribacillus halophilus]|uniref:Competence protein ComK n=1 Tax=Terribacillus halophilus TaxID=361279 RepID=A0A1G6PCP2_9BACI|nr:competence protein ComK [Terribacillus halophilus]SDC77819.1 competence protein ComK [Terribacillus halophilus]